jgi:hypothetical protein
MTAVGPVPKAAETDEQKSNLAASAVGEPSESESKFCKPCSCVVKLARGIEKLTAQAQCTMCVVSFCMAL